MNVDFYASFGDEDSVVKLRDMLGGYYHVFIDNYYAGSINHMSTGWIAYLHDDYMLTYADNQILIDIIIGEFMPAKLIQEK